MGNHMSNYFPRAQSKISGRKRRQDSNDHDGQDLDQLMRIPKRRKLTSTAKFIYENLFVKGHSSDITIVALAQEWKLHKLYLSQSPYFSCMFTGGWKESDQNLITLHIVDEKIDVEALRAVFGSLYLDEITLKPINVIPILAAATMFQLDNLITQCSSIMKATASMATVMTYFEASEEYGLTTLKAFLTEWLLYNLTTNVKDHPDELRKISIDLMVELIKSTDLFVVQTEFCLYAILKTWVFLRENPDFLGTSFNECLDKSDSFFHDVLLENEYFLEKDDGQNYSNVFSSLRLEHLLNHISDVRVIQSDRILPPSWMYPVFSKLWCSMLELSTQNSSEMVAVVEESFNKDCMRCGRIIDTDKPHIWRWVGFNYNANLVFSYKARVLSVKRQEISNNLPFNLYIMLENRHLAQKFVVEVSVASLHKEQGHLTYKNSTPIKTISFENSSEIILMKLKKKATFPLVVIAKFMFNI